MLLDKVIEVRQVAEHLEGRVSIVMSESTCSTNYQCLECHKHSVFVLMHQIWKGEEILTTNIRLTLDFKATVAVTRVAIAEISSKVQVFADPEE